MSPPNRGKKAELLEGDAFADAEEAQMKTFIYIETYYNRARRRSALGYQSPEDFERAYKVRSQQTTACCAGCFF